MSSKKKYSKAERSQRDMLGQILGGLTNNLTDAVEQGAKDSVRWPTGAGVLGGIWGVINPKEKLKNLRRNNRS